jgi:hypothetical protein
MTIPREMDEARRLMAQAPTNRPTIARTTNAYCLARCARVAIAQAADRLVMLHTVRLAQLCRPIDQLAMIPPLSTNVATADRRLFVKILSTACTYG